MKNPLRYQITEYDCGPTSMLRRRESNPRCSTRALFGAFRLVVVALRHELSL